MPRTSRLFPTTVSWSLWLPWETPLIGSSLAAATGELAPELRALVAHCSDQMSLAVGGGRCAEAVGKAGLADRVHVIRSFPDLDHWEPVIRATADVLAAQRRGGS